MKPENAGAYAFLGLPVLGVMVMLATGCLHTVDSPRVRVSPPTVPAYADCSGESPVDPCVIP